MARPAAITSVNRTDVSRGLAVRDLDNDGSRMR
jgi:hypothetical protein